jgi:hypothetical protein
MPTMRPSTMILRPAGSGVVSRIPVFEGSALRTGATPAAAPLAAGFFAAEALGGGSAAAVGGGGGSGAGAGGGWMVTSAEGAERSTFGERALIWL